MSYNIISANVVINHKTTKFEINSQRNAFLYWISSCCYQSQNYKIWNQFTTQTTDKSNVKQLLSIAKLQNLKAIHNSSAYFNKEKQDVINHKTTKFESNSQPYTHIKSEAQSCYQSQNYKIWKQITTLQSVWRGVYRLLSIAKL